MARHDPIGAPCFGWVGPLPDATADHPAARFAAIADRAAAVRRLVPPAAAPGARLAAADTAGVLWAEDDDHVLCVVGRARGAAGDDLGSALLADYARRGASCLEALHGQFALIIAARDGSRVLLASDRVGTHALCWAAFDGGLAFATDATLIAALRGDAHGDADIDPQALYDYLYFHVVPIPESAFPGIQRLGPGEYLEYADGVARPARYHRTAYRPERRLDFAAARREFRALIDAAVQPYLDDGREVGAFLSGGTDSSTLVGTLGKLGGAAPRCFSIGFDAPGFDETEYARIAARRFGAEHHEYYIRPADIVDAIPRIAAHTDAPFGNSSVVPAYFCARLARERGIELLLGGDGGDELFGGNERYSEPRLYAPWESTPAPLRGLIRGLVDLLPGGDALWPVRKARAYIAAADVPMPDRTQRYVLLNRLGAERVLHPDFLARIDRGHPAALLREVYRDPDAASPLNRFLAMDMKFTLADNDLPKVNTACALGGVEVAYPLLDDRLVAFAARLPDDFKLRGKRLRWFFKEALADFLPTEIIHKSKHGFGLPFGLWMNEHAPLRELVDDSLGTLRGRGLINPAFIDDLLGPLMREHASYYGSAVWILVMLEQWLRAHTDVTPAPSAA